MASINLQTFIVGLAASVSLLVGTRAASAQVSEVPAPDSEGDFNTAIVRGNRGFYVNQRWVVVPGTRRDALNCRYTPNGEIRSQIIPGAILTAQFGGPVNLDGGQSPNTENDAIEMYQGSPWLKITGVADTLLYPADRTNVDSLGPCYVRANLRYITPLNNEATIPQVFGR